MPTTHILFIGADSNAAMLVGLIALVLIIHFALIRHSLKCTREAVEESVEKLKRILERRE